jgi:hypothetical protein
MLMVLRNLISFLDKNNQPVTFKAGDMVFVDFKTMIAYADGHHFEIEPQEVTYLH